jgi:hypothetical protein
VGIIAIPLGFAIGMVAKVILLALALAVRMRRGWPEAGPRVPANEASETSSG